MIRIETRNHASSIKKTQDGTRYEKVMAVVRWLKMPLVLRILLLIASTLLALSFGIWFLSSSHTSFARSTSFETCATVRVVDKPKFCNGMDPIQSDCTADAQTVAEQPVMLDGQTVGLAQIRYSPRCNSYWARGFSYLPGKSVSVYVSELGKGDNASFLSTNGSAYSNMVYSSVPTVTIQVYVLPTQVAGVTIAGVH
jgi:hypothetical protein